MVSAAQCGAVHCTCRDLHPQPWAAGNQGQPTGHGRAVQQQPPAGDSSLPPPPCLPWATIPLRRFRPAAHTLKYCLPAGSPVLEACVPRSVVVVNLQGRVPHAAWACRQVRWQGAGVCPSARRQHMTSKHMSSCSPWKPLPQLSSLDLKTQLLTHTPTLTLHPSDARAQPSPPAYPPMAKPASGGVLVFLVPLPHTSRNCRHSMGMPSQRYGPVPRLLGRPRHSYRI